MLHIGLDVGSTTVKIAVLDDENNAVYKNYQRHYSDIKKTIAEVLGGCLETIDEKNVTVAVTGSGGISVKQNLCMLAERLSIYLPICRTVKKVVVPKVVNHRRPGPLDGPDPGFPVKR